MAAVVRETLDEVAAGRLSLSGVGVRFWDGSELPGDGAAGVVVRDPAAIVH